MAHSLLAMAQVAPRPEPQNVVELSATGTVESEQDWIVIRLQTTREGLDPAVLQSQVKAALELALGEARNLAQPGQLEVSTGRFNLHPRHGRDGKISGWQGSAELVLEGRDIARISSLAGRIQSMSLSQVNFSLSRELRQRSEAEAQRLAIEGFKTKASEISKGFGFTNYGLRQVTVHADAGGGPMPRPRAMAMEARSVLADAPVPVEAGKSLIQITVSGSIQMR